MKPNNVGRDMWLRFQTTNQKFKQNAPTEVADDKLVWSVLYMTQLEAVSQQ